MFVFLCDYRGPGSAKDYRGDAIGARETSRDVPTGKMGLPEQFHFFWEFPVGRTEKRFSFSPEPEFSEFLTEWKAPLGNLFYDKIMHLRSMSDV